MFCTNVTRKITGYRNGTAPPTPMAAACLHPLIVSDTDFVNRNSNPSSVANLTVQKGFSEVWRKLEPSLPPSSIHLLPNIQEAVELVEDLSEELGELQIFVTGSLHLVGGVISILEGVMTPVLSKESTVDDAPIT